MYEYGAGIWLFGQFVDRYASDAYGPPVSTVEAIEKAATVPRPDVARHQLPLQLPRRDRRGRQGRARAHGPQGDRGHAPHLHAPVREGLLHQPRPGHSPGSGRPVQAGHRGRGPARRLLPQVLARPGRLRLSVPGRLRTSLGPPARRRPPGGRVRARAPVRHRVQAQGTAQPHVLQHRGADAAGHRGHRRSQPGHRARHGPLAVRQGDAGRRPPAHPSARSAGQRRGQRQPARVGRRHGRWARSTRSRRWSSCGACGRSAGIGRCCSTSSRSARTRSVQRRCQHPGHRGHGAVARPRRCRQRSRTRRSARTRSPRRRSSCASWSARAPDRTTRGHHDTEERS